MVFGPDLELVFGTCQWYLGSGPWISDMVLEFGTWSFSIWDIGSTYLNLEFLGSFIWDLKLGNQTWCWDFGPGAGF